MTATTDRCPGCHGSGIEMSGVTYAGMSEYVGCHECGPECPDDCGCRVDAEPERPESIAARHPGATQSPDGSQGATEHVEITPDGNVQVMTTSWHEGSPYSCARPGCPAGCDRNDPTTEAPSDVRPSPPARDAVSMDSAVTDAEAAEWARLVAEATEGPWVVDPDGSIGAPMAGFVCGEDGHPRLDCSECGTRVCHVNVIPGDPDAAFIAAAWAAVPRLLADRDRLKGERDRAIGFATRVEAENARMVEWNAITTRAFETTRRVLQEASGLPDDIDDPDCRDEMVLALRPRAEKAEAEVARLRAGIEALAAEMQSDTCPSCHVSYADEGSTTWGCDHTEGMQHAGDMLRALLADGGDRG